MNVRDFKPEGQFDQNSEKDAGENNRITDDELWKGIIANDKKSIEILYNRYASILCKYGFQITKDDSIVYDSIQDTFLYLIQKSENLSAPVNVKAYLFASYRRKVLSLLKESRSEKNRHDEISMNEELFENGDSILMHVNEDYRPEIKKLILASTSQLSTRQQEVIFLHFYEGLSYKDIAETMQFKNVRSARNLLYKAIDILSVSLKKYKSDIWPIILTSALTALN
ncbi:RNA polymerase sigma-70 factor, ECF subfamily [Algoriphagus locisalis]|uniref:RNA polymerase sigma-70 factor, ECF subfamily n=1 Tax=Algoriphagus locisalis TaxID=305507 RepID=A0A1I7E450_9BACT|nr:sigma-70 family RNA polymerase sigma factor [Algoriphagus locisalis]SFU18712.1 RNA polymerase sigma-70 factor, ECF subfamily [Algoriphagus locisalis]